MGAPAPASSSDTCSQPCLQPSHLPPGRLQRVPMIPPTPPLLCSLLCSGRDVPHSHSVASHCPPGKSELLELHLGLQSPKCTCHQGPPASLACPCPSTTSGCYLFPVPSGSPEPPHPAAPSALTARGCLFSSAPSSGLPYLRCEVAAHLGSPAPPKPHTGSRMGYQMRVQQVS